jgi:hypothetical protein
MYTRKWALELSPCRKAGEGKKKGQITRYLLTFGRRNKKQIVDGGIRMFTVNLVSLLGIRDKK